MIEEENKVKKSKNHKDGGILKRNKLMQELANNKEGRFLLLDVFLIFLIIAVPEFLVEVVLSIILIMTNKLEMYNDFISGSGDYQIIFQLFLTIPTLVIAIVFWKFISKKSLFSMGFIRKGAISSYLKGLLLGFIMISCAWLIVIITKSGDFVLEGFSLSKLFVYLLIFIGFLFQGMEEEVLCRGIFMNNLSLRYPVIVAIIGNSLIFAALHLLNDGITLLAFINLILFGAFASLYYYYTENIWGIAALHSMWNFTQGNILGVLVSGINSGTTLISTTMYDGREIINGGLFGLEGGLGVTIVYGIGITVMIHLIYTKNKIKN